jgi:hypothetical protein
VLGFTPTLGQSRVATGIQTWIGRRSVWRVKFPNLFMLEHVVVGGDALEENVVENVQNESHVMDKSSIKKKGINQL